MWQTRAGKAPGNQDAAPKTAAAAAAPKWKQDMLAAREAKQQRAQVATEEDPMQLYGHLPAWKRDMKVRKWREERAKKTAALEQDRLAVEKKRAAIFSDPEGVIAQRRSTFVEEPGAQFLDKSPMSPSSVINRVDSVSYSALQAKAERQSVANAVAAFTSTLEEINQTPQAPQRRRSYGSVKQHLEPASEPMDVPPHASAADDGTEAMIGRQASRSLEPSTAARTTDSLAAAKANKAAQDAAQDAAQQAAQQAVQDSKREKLAASKKAAADQAQADEQRLAKQNKAAAAAKAELITTEPAAAMPEPPSGELTVAQCRDLLKSAQAAVAAASKSPAPPAGESTSAARLRRAKEREARSAAKIKESEAQKVLFAAVERQRAADARATAEEKERLKQQKAADKRKAEEDKARAANQLLKRNHAEAIARRKAWAESMGKHQNAAMERGQTKSYPRGIVMPEEANRERHKKVLSWVDICVDDGSLTEVFEYEKAVYTSDDDDDGSDAVGDEEDDDGLSTPVHSSFGAPAKPKPSKPSAPNMSLPDNIKLLEVTERDDAKPVDDPSATFSSMFSDAASMIF